MFYDSKFTRCVYKFVLIFNVTSYCIVRSKMCHANVKLDISSFREGDFTTLETIGLFHWLENMENLNISFRNHRLQVIIKFNHSTFRTGFSQLLGIWSRKPFFLLLLKKKEEEVRNLYVIKKKRGRRNKLICIISCVVVYNSLNTFTEVNSQA